jgi:UDP:flavonoid glycosyltransferase YjiC (YdhE family)
MLVVPYGWDQPDKARRNERLGEGLHLPRARNNAETASAAIRFLLDNAQIEARCAELGSCISGENAIELACDRIESLVV